MSNQRQIVQDALQKQAGSKSKQDFVQQMTALYEARITAATSAKDMLALREDLLNHKKENRRHRRRVSLFANTAAAVVALATGGAGAVAAVAGVASVVSGAGLITFLIVGSITYAVGYTVFESAKALFQMEKDARDKTEAENTALTGLENKLQQKLSPDGQPSAETSSPAKKLSLLGRLRALFKKSAEKPTAPPATPESAATATQKNISIKKYLISIC
ncbi:MAG: hypothetical protein K8R48_07190 [Alphaproteobacteria bacterium]|nr:hypothetical protein [Alphaproteobacteria bacterium]